MLKEAHQIAKAFVPFLPGLKFAESQLSRKASLYVLAIER